MPKETLNKIKELLETMTSYYFKGGEYADQDLYCEDIARKILELFPDTDAVVKKLEGEKKKIWLTEKPWSKKDSENFKFNQATE